MTNNSVLTPENTNTPAAQVRGDMGIVVPTEESSDNSLTDVSAAKAVNFDIERAIENGWVEDKFRTKDGNLVKCIVAPLVGTPMVILKKTAEKVEYDGKETYRTVLYVIFLDNDDLPLHNDFLRLKLSSSATSATFWEIYDKPGNNGNYFSTMQKFHKENHGVYAKAFDMATYIFEPIMEVKPVGQGSKKSLATRFTGFVPAVRQITDPTVIEEAFQSVVELVNTKREKGESSSTVNSKGSVDMKRVEDALLTLGGELMTILGKDKQGAVANAFYRAIDVLRGEICSGAALERANTERLARNVKKSPNVDVDNTDF